MSWTFIYLMLILKIPVFALLYLVWWSIHQTPDEWTAASEEDGGIKHAPPRHPRPRLPRTPRRGPHGAPAPPPPPRTRARPVVARARTPHR
jgi:hypothetical protein